MYQDFGYTLAHAQTVCTRPSFGPGDEATKQHEVNPLSGVSRCT